MPLLDAVYVKRVEKEQFSSGSGIRGAKFWVSRAHIYTHRHMYVVIVMKDFFKLL